MGIHSDVVFVIEKGLEQKIRQSGEQKVLKLLNRADRVIPAEDAIRFEWDLIVWDEEETDTDYYALHKLLDQLNENGDLYRLWKLTSEYMYEGYSPVDTWGSYYHPTLNLSYHLQIQPVKQEVIEPQKKEIEIRLPLGYSLIWHQFIDHEHLACVWYGGLIAEIQHGNLVSKLYAVGDIRVSFEEEDGSIVEVVDKNKAGRFYDELSNVIKNDKALSEAVEMGRLTFDNNNWFEFFFYDAQTGKEIDMPFDSLLDDYTLDDAIHSVIAAMQETAK